MPKTAMRTRLGHLLWVASISAFHMTGCGSGVQNVRGQATTYNDVQGRGMISGVGIEAQDIVSTTDEMLRSIIASGVLTRSTKVPRVIMDARYFSNEGSQALNKNLIIDRLRSELMRAAQGRILFVARENIDMVEHERALKREGVTDVGTTGLTRATAGADYRLTGRIGSLDAISSVGGGIERYNQITFELVDLEFGTIVWSDQFEFRKAAIENAVYR